MPGESVIHALDPRTKLAGAFVIIVTILAFSSWPVILYDIILLAAAVLLAGVELRSLIRGIRWFWLVIVLSFLAQAVLIEGEVLLKMGPLDITVEGVQRGFITTIRIIALYFTSVLLNMVTSPVKLAGGLEAVFFPLNYIRIPVSKIAMMISISLRFVPTILEEAEDISRAQISRGAPLNSQKLTDRFRGNMAVVIPLIASSLQRASDLAMAMESRCYTGGINRNRLKELKFGRNDVVALVLICAVFLLPLAVKYMN